ncbi:MAG: isocitrate lyase/phosphoenolpyruvate mutase family protein [Gemmatimonadaceae bacterium]
MTDTAVLRARFRELHQSGCFVIPNPWDAGSARLLEQAGFRALASTSAGIAWSMAKRDNGVSLDATLARLREIVDAVDVPVNADFEGGFAIEPNDVATNVAKAIDTGISGLSIEDSTGDASNPLFDFALAVERIRAARRAIDASGSGVFLTARTEGFIVGRPDIDETVRRLSAFAEAGADCLYAPGIQRPEHISTVVRAVSPKPVNVLVGANFTTLADLAELGVRRVSVGGAFARVAFAAMVEAATELSAHGTFGGLATALTFAHLNSAFPPSA